MTISDIRWILLFSIASWIILDIAAWGKLATFLRAVGKVRADGAIWSAECDPDEASLIEVDDEVRVERAEGLTLIVRKR